MTHRSDGSAIEPRSRAIRKCVKSQVYPVSLVHDADITVETQRIRLLIPYVFLYTTFDSHDPRCRIRSAMWWQAANISSARARLPPLRSATLPCPPAPLPSPRPPPCLALSQSQLAPPQHHWCMLAAHRPQARPLVARAPSVVRAAPACRSASPPSRAPPPHVLSLQSVRRRVLSPPRRHIRPARAATHRLEVLRTLRAPPLPPPSPAKHHRNATTTTPSTTRIVWPTTESSASACWSPCPIDIRRVCGWRRGREQWQWWRRRWWRRQGWRGWWG